MWTGRIALHPGRQVEKITYVFPNLSSLAQRGGLSERWDLAMDEGCGFVEVPADFIKNVGEVRRTGSEMGSVLRPKDIEILYRRGENLPPGLEYILHTEPAIGRRDEDDRFYKASLRWDDGEWRRTFSRMLLDISSHLGKPASIIEIHSGGKENSLGIGS